MSNIVQTFESMLVLGTVTELQPDFIIQTACHTIATMSRTTVTRPVLSRQRLSERIADELQHEILADGAVPGTRLPTEAQLVERYQVSRTVVREAARHLVQRGLVTVAPGRGMVVAAFDGRLIAEQFALQMQVSEGSFTQLLELRLALEVQVSTAAAQSASPEHLEGLGQLISRGRELMEDSEELNTAEFLDADIRFHELLTEATGNPFFTLVCRPINQFLREHYTLQDRYPSSAERTLEEHALILQALKHQDTFAARQATEQHLMRLFATEGE